MNEFFQKLKQEALNTKLSQNEKLHMRAALYDAVKKTPATLVQEVRVVRQVRSSYVWLSPAYASAFAAVLIAALGTGTAYAAQGALPGDLLYPVKININERVEVKLALGDTAKAQAEAALAGRRVSEAQELEAEGRLDATTTQELEDNFNEHAGRALALSGSKPVATAFSQTVQPQNENQEGQDASASSSIATLKSAVLMRVATSSAKVEDNSAISKQKVEREVEGEDIPKSLEKQRKILNELKLRVEGRKHGGEERSSDNSNNKSNDNINDNSGNDD
jgi:hypothetical protein